MTDVADHPNHQAHSAHDNDEKSSGTSFKGIITTIFLGIVSAIVGYAVSFVSDHRKSEIEFVNSQIEKLYGPLYAYGVANAGSWTELHQRRGGDPDYFHDHPPVTAQDVEIWRRWMTNVFMPKNIKMEEVIIENSQLLDKSKIYPVFEDLITHIESYKATIARWDAKDELSDPKNKRGRLIRRATSIRLKPIIAYACFTMLR
jgi:hypothetical protein